MVTAIITCAGVGLRAGFKENKLLQKINGERVIDKTLSNFVNNPLIDEIILTSSVQDFKEFCDILKPYPNARVVIGGETRGQSVHNALKDCKTNMVLIHDGARPFVTNEIIADCIESVKKFGSGIASIPATDTIGVVENGKIARTERKDRLSIQTPQGFLTKDILKAYNQVTDFSLYTDDAGVYSKFIGNPTPSLGDVANKKLTYRQDFDQGILVGTGFDLHQLVEGRDLILGGIKIPHTKGLLGHSDADVLTHAIMDAILSTLSLGDIGKHFSDKDMKYKDISSIILLKRVLEMIDEHGYKVRNVSAVIMAEKPKLSTFTEKISTYLSEVIHIAPERVGITCTTLEKIGIVGREEGIACQAFCSVEKK